MTAASDWVATSERIPDSDRWVLILLESGLFAVGKFVPRNNSWRIGGMTGPLSTKQVSHWADVYKPTKETR